MRVTSADFLKSAAEPGGYPPEELPEAAFIGRSNVGKSSLINVLTGRKALARTSSTPGRTQLLNFFKINDRLLMVDLPGFGYAKAPEAVRRAWRPMIESYLDTRRVLKVVVCLFDIRRDPEREEMGVIERCAGRGVACLPVLTKADKLSGNKRSSRRASAAKRFGMSPGDLLLFSSLTGEGKRELWRAILYAIERPAAGCGADFPSSPDEPRRERGVVV